MLAQVEPPPWSVVFGLMVGIGLLVVLSGVLVIRIARRAANGDLERNRWAGIRTKATTASDEAWLVAHRVGLAKSVLAGRLLAGSGVMAAALGLAIGTGNPTRTLAVWGISLGVLPLGALIPIVQASLAGDRAAMEVADTATS